MVIEKLVLNVSHIIASPVYAQAQPPRIEELANTFEGLFQWIFPIGAVIAVAMIIYGGYMWIVSAGDPARKQIAQGTLTWAVLGLVFLFLIGALLQILLEFVIE